MLVARCGLLALLLPLLTGCPALDWIRQLGTPGLTTEEQPAAVQAAEVLTYMRYVNNLYKTGNRRQAALRSELELMEQQVQADQRLTDQTKLAWLLTLPGSGFQDARRGLDSLSHIGEAAGDGALADLTGLVAATVGKRIALSHKLRSADARYRNAEQQRLALEEKVLLLEQETADLQDKINALTHLESGIGPTDYTH